MKKLISLILCVCICASLLPSFAFAADRDVSHEEMVAADLKALNLFKGVSETNFDLNRAPTRIEALIMLIRVLGQENAALSGTWSHPFTDVPAWADKYVGYAYSNGLTNGVSATQFGSGNVSSAMYLTFMLRALGYSDTNGEDFTWDNPYNLASGLNILPTSVNIESFLRADAVMVSYAALNASIKDSSLKLSDALIEAGVFTEEKYNSVYDILKATAIAEYYEDIVYLRDFIVTNGEYEKTTDFGIAVEIYTLSFEHEAGDHFFEIRYTPTTGYITLSESYYGESQMLDTTLQIAGNATTKSSARVIFGLNDGYESVIAAANVPQSSYKADSTISFHIGFSDETSYDKTQCETVCRDMLNSILTTTESVFTTFELPLSISDFGYTSFQ